MSSLPHAIVSRAQWGARPPNTDRLRLVEPADRHKIGGTVHHTTGATLGHPDFSQWCRNIQAEHMDGRGYGDIAYGTLIDPYGRVYVGRDENRFVGAHASSRNNQANRQTRGIAFLGDLTNVGPTAAAQAAAFWCFDLMRLAGDQTLAFCHADWAEYGPPAIVTACPGMPGGRLWVAHVLRPHLGSIPA